MINNAQDAKIKLVANIRLDRARLYSFENKTRTSKDQKRKKKNKIRSPCNAQPQDGKASARCKLQQRHQRYLYCYSDTATRKCGTHPLK